MDNAPLVTFLGEYECRLDTKSRIMLPSALQRQMPPEAEGRFVLTRGFEECLVLYPYTEWQREMSAVLRQNQYLEETRQFVRYIMRGATELQLDSAQRLLLPKKLLTYAHIDKDLILSAVGNKIEVWEPALYDKVVSDKPADFAFLANKVMGGLPHA